MKKAPKKNPAISRQKRSKAARSGNSSEDQPITPEPEPRNLDPSQQRALVALFEERSIAAAARRTGIGERTIRRWLHDNPDFRDELRHIRRQQLAHAATRLQSTSSQAVQTLLDLLASKDHIETGRAALIRTALDFAFRAGSYTDLAERIDELEQAAAEQKDRPPAKKPSRGGSLIENSDSQAA